MSNHTPGPWVVSDIPTKDLRIRAAGDGGAPDIGVVFSRISRTDAETEANARLVASAPDLLEALQRLDPFLDAIVCYASTMGEHEPNRHVVSARAAIAKATGG